jgi:toxin-antitoxin system PIN domain toxin
VLAIDTNILVYAHQAGLPRHPPALRRVRDLAEGANPFALPWPCAYEFLRVVTHPRVFHPPVPLARAVADLQRVMSSPSLRLLAETPRHSEVMASILESSVVTGNLVHDAHIAALCLEHGVSEFLTGDRDFERFESLNVVHPY